jgi:hypothetical protein
VLGTARGGSSVAIATATIASSAARSTTALVEWHVGGSDNHVISNDSDTLTRLCESIGRWLASIALGLESSTRRRQSLAV